MYHFYKVFKQVIGRWLSLVNSHGFGNKLVFPPENHKGKSLSHTAVASKLLVRSLCKTATFFHHAPVAQLVEHWVVTREVVSSTPAGPTLRVSE